MNRRLVLKRLSASDLTLFEYHFRNTNGTKQKAINLDAAVFIGELYPGMPDRMSLRGGRIPLDLWIFGPGTAGPHNLQRKILKQDKNWRLNGELIYSPSDEGEDKERYNNLQKGDYALMEFVGEQEPTAAKVYLIASSLPDDSALYGALESKYASGFSSRKGMQIVNPNDLAEIIRKSNIPEAHPVYDLTEEDVLEDAAYGGLEGFQILRKRRKARGVGHGEFALAKDRAEKNGVLGEELLNAWLTNEVQNNRIPGFIWEAQKNAIAPYDFIILKDNKPVRKVDAKSTSGAFTNNIHVSISELNEMAYGGVPYDIYRLYFINETIACMRVAENVGEFAKRVLNSLASLPNGVMADGVTMHPSTLIFGEEVLISSELLSESE